MIVARGLGRGAYLGAIVAAGLCIATPDAAEAVNNSQVYGGKYREDVSREIVEKQWELVDLRKSSTNKDNLFTQDNKPESANSQVLVANKTATVELIKSNELSASQVGDEKAKHDAFLRKRQDEEALLMILLNL